MVRTQIQLTEAQVQALKQLAAQRGASMAELVRQSIDQFIVVSKTGEDDRKAKRQRAKLLGGLFHSGLSDLGRNHDHYLVEAYSNGRYSEEMVDE